MNNKLGDYILNFLYINLYTNTEPEKYFENDDIQKTIIHEYIHFIQNISTVNGMLGLINVINEISSFFNSNPSVNLHYVSNDNEVIFWKDVLNICENQADTENTVPFSITNAEIVRDTMGLPCTKGNTTLLVYPYYVDISLGSYTQRYEFGSEAIKECMSYTFENGLIPNNTPNTYWTIPYDLVEIIFHFNYPCLLNKSFMYAFCDASLMSQNPPETFENMLNLMKSTNFIPNSSKDIYDFFIQNIGIIYPGYSFYNNWKDIFDKTINRINNVINIKHYSFAANWCLDIIKYYNHLKVKHIDFFSEILNFRTPPERLNYFKGLMNYKTSPLIINNKNQVSYIGSPKLSKRNSQQLFFWYNYSLMYKYIFINSDTCPYDFCNEKCIYRQKPYNKIIYKNTFKNRIIIQLRYIIYKIFKISCNKLPCVFTEFSQSIGLYKHEIIQNNDIIP